MNLDYELDYWRNDGIKKGREHQRKYCLSYRDYFEKLLGGSLLQFLLKDATCVEVGPGPFGGMSLVLFPKLWMLIDPLWDEYKKLVDCSSSKKTYINSTIETALVSAQSVDAVFCTNALDHTVDRKKAECSIFNMLKNYGLFFLVVHCRTKEELNAGHQQVFTAKDLKNEIMEIGFKEINSTVITDRFIPAQKRIYTTFVGIFEKRLNTGTL